MRHLLTFVLLCCFIFAGCATEPFKPGSPLKSEGIFFFGRTFSQEGKLVSFSDVSSHLGSDSQTSASISSAQYWYFGSLITAGIGGYLIGWSLVSTSDSKTSGLLAGAALVGVSAGASYYADKHIVEAIDAYNRKLGKANRFPIMPTLSFAQNLNASGDKALAPLVGFALSY